MNWKKLLWHLTSGIEARESCGGSCIIHLQKEYQFLGNFSALPARCFPSLASSLAMLCPAASPCLYYCGPAFIQYQKPPRRAVLGRPLALQEALFWVSVLMLCCKCILFKGCTNYKLVLGDEDKNIFSQPVSVNNLWCYLEMWYSFHVAGNACAACGGLQQPQCSFLVVRLTNEAGKEFFCMLGMAKWIFMTFFSTELREKFEFTSRL